MSRGNLDYEASLDAFHKRRGTECKNNQNSQEYFEALERWLMDVRSYAYSYGFLTGMPYSLADSRQQSYSFYRTQPQINYAFPAPQQNQDMGMFIFPRAQQGQVNEDQGIEYKIPPLWKRFAAEFVDFMLLFLLKLAITFVAVDFFDTVDLDDISIFQKKHSEMDYKLSIEMTSGILFLEMIHRLIVCIYENCCYRQLLFIMIPFQIVIGKAFARCPFINELPECTPQGIFLHKGAQNQVGGATPGKSLMGIKVVFCCNVQQVGNVTNTVKVYPATNLGLGWSFARAFLKNLVLALLIPIIFPLFFNKFHRTGYDILCNSIVVEESME